MNELQEVKAYVAKLDDSLFSKELAPHYMQLSSKLASSELVPKCFRNKPQDLFICWAMGYQIGLSPEQSMQCIAVINGKAAMWGDDMLALCMAHKDFEDISENEIRSQDETVIGYRCIVKRKGVAPKSNDFTLDMAKRAGLLAKGGVWSQYPERMLKLRARGFTLRDAFPDALKGIKPREEVEDYIDADYTVAEHKGSRTELLKKDLLTKAGKLDAENIMDNDSSLQDYSARKEDTSDAEQYEAAKDGEDPTKLHAEIKRLLVEKSFPEERLLKALTYYEVTTIEDLCWEGAHHFYNLLEKL